MFPSGFYGVGVAIAPLEELVPGEGVRAPADAEPWPSRLGELLPVAGMTAAQKAAQIQRVIEAEAQLAAYRAELVVGLAADRPASADRTRGQVGAASSLWAAELLDGSVSEFFCDEVALIVNTSRAQATVEWERSATLCRRLPGTWAALADGRLDKPRAWAMAAELGWPARETPDHVLAAVEAAVLPRAGELSIRRLRDLCRAELIKVDPAAADRRREKARAESDVTVRGLSDGMSEVRAPMPAPEAAELAAVVDARARDLKAAGDERPIGLIRAEVLHALVTRPGRDEPAVAVHVTVHAALDSLESAAAGAPGAGTDPPTVDGMPITPAQARVLLERIDALCPGGLQPPTGGSLLISVTDPAGRQLAVLTRRELESAVRHGRGLGPPAAVDRYEHTPAQERFVTTRDRGCRWPGCPENAGWADLDHVLAHAEGGATDCTNLCCACRRHHRLKTHTHGWTYTMSDDGVLSVTTPSGITRVSRPPGLPPPPDPDEPPPF